MASWEVLLVRDDQTWPEQHRSLQQFQAQVIFCGEKRQLGGETSQEYSCNSEHLPDSRE